MNLEIPQDEVKRDLIYTDTDIANLTSIIVGLEGFILHSGGENRQAFRGDLNRYRMLLDEAHKLREHIAKHLL